MAIQQPNNHLSDGLDHVLPGSQKRVILDGIQYNQLTRTDRREELSKPARAFRALVGILAFPINAWKRGREWGLGSAIDGRIKRDVRYGGVDPLQGERDKNAVNPNSAAMQRHIQAMRALGADENYRPSALIERLGYDPKNRMSVRAYLERPEIKAQMIYDKTTGNYMLPVNDREGTSSFLFVPKGDFSKASSIVMSDAKTGESLKGHAFSKAMHTYQSQYDDMVKGIEENVDYLTTQLRKKYGDEEIEDEELRTQVKNQFRVAVLDHKRKNTRFFSHINPNYRGIYTNPFKGTRIDWEKSTVEHTDEIQRTKQPERLPNDRPFEHLANQRQQPTNQNIPQVNNEDDNDSSNTIVFEDDD